MWQPFVLTKSINEPFKTRKGLFREEKIEFVRLWEKRRRNEPKMNGNSKRKMEGLGEGLPRYLSYERIRKSCR